MVVVVCNKPVINKLASQRGRRRGRRLTGRNRNARGRSHCRQRGRGLLPATPQFALVNRGGLISHGIWTRLSQRPGQPKPTDASGISDFSSIPRRDPALPGPSSISSFPSKGGQSSGSADPPARPRPKAIKRPIPVADAGGAAASSSIVDASAGPSMFGSTALLGGGSAIGDYPLTLAERAKTRVRNTKAAISPPVTSPSPGKSGTTSSGKLKKTKSAALPLDDEVIDISTDEENVKRKQKTKTKQHQAPEPPKDRAVAAKAKAPAPAPEHSQMTMTSIPVFTSSILPPSDPPPPSSIHS
ncbi:hypothetical protein FIBSPDRAFT_917924, partial [Athelia psychrophila]